ncbi:MAG: hypothetical protein MK345_03055 [SAR202 cluster bacterium]|nr:hypothetical protein [SAR202 cluster bacterium]
MNNSEKEAIETALLWNEEGFNKRDRKISVDLMHFPHVRLWNNQFSIFNSEEEFLKGFDLQTQKLEQEGWTHTVTKDIQAVQSDESKVHLLLLQSRRNKDDIEIENFQTLWIMTKIDGKWGIKFRSSFVAGSSQISEITI